MAMRSNNGKNMSTNNMTVQEAGKKGGTKTSQTHGRDFYQQIGHKGGKIGGEATSKKYGPAFYSEIGHRGGSRVRELINKGKQQERM
jgi:general stress protein YciG